MALDGLGGMGKTQIALQFAYLIQETSPKYSVFWVQASDAISFDTSYREIAQKLGIVGLEDDKIDVKQLVFIALRSLTSPWLLIVDNADDYKVLGVVDERNAARALIEYLPTRGNGAVLFTTRDQKAATKFAEANVIHVKEMDRQESLQLLKASVQEQKHNLLDDAVSMHTLLDLLLDLPLAIKQAAAYINENSTPVRDYLSFYNNSEEDMIEILSEGFEDRGRHCGQKNPVATTWFISFEQVRRDDVLAAEYLSFMGVIARDDIPRSLLPSAETRNQQNKAIGTLIAYSFVVQRLTGDAFDVHRLVHLATRNWLSEKHTQSMWTDRALHRLVKVIPAGSHAHREVWTRYLPHGIYVVDTIETYTENERAVIQLRDKIGRCQYTTGQYIEAAKMHQATLALRREVLGKKHPETLISMNEVAAALSGQGKYADAEAMNRQTLAISEEVLGKTHPDTFTSMSNLALVLDRQGKYADAEAMNRQTLEIREEVLGKTHPDTLMSMSNLARVLDSQGKYADAEAMNRQTLAIREEVLGKTHPDTLTSVYCLAHLLQKKEEYKEASILYQRACTGYKLSLGSEHPTTKACVSHYSIMLNRLE